LRAPLGMPTPARSQLANMMDFAAGVGMKM
jgi:hypothetical protein